MEWLLLIALLTPYTERCALCAAGVLGPALRLVSYNSVTVDRLNATHTREDGGKWGEIAESALKLN